MNGLSIQITMRKELGKEGREVSACFVHATQHGIAQTAIRGPVPKKHGSAMKAKNLSASKNMKISMNIRATQNFITYSESL